MSKKNIGDLLIEGLEEAIQHARGKKTKAIVHEIWVPDHINVLNIRKNMKLTRLQFAKKFGFSDRTVQHWEQGDRTPRGPARILLAILEKRPDVINCLRASNDGPLKKNRKIIKKNIFHKKAS